MTIANDAELAITKAKLGELQSRYESVRDDRDEDLRVRRLTAISLKRLINQLIEEISRYESGVPAA